MRQGRFGLRRQRRGESDVCTDDRSRILIIRTLPSGQTGWSCPNLFRSSFIICYHHSDSYLAIKRMQDSVKKGGLETFIRY